MSVTFNPTFNTLAARSYRLITGQGADVNGGAITNDQLTQALLAANLMLKNWQSSGVNLYRRTQVTLSIGAGQGTPANPYPFSPNVIGVMECRWVINPSPNLYERPLGAFTYIQYMRLPNKYSGGSSPSVYMYDRQQAGSNLYLYPYVANGGQVNASVVRIANDISSPSATVDLPQEWLETFVYCLADRLMDDEALSDAAQAANTATRITQRAERLYKSVLDFDRPDSIYIQPEGSAGRRLRRP